MLQTILSERKLCSIFFLKNFTGFIQSFFIIASISVYNSVSAQCTTAGDEATLTSGITAPNCTNQAVAGTIGIGPGSRKIYSGFTAGQSVQLFVNTQSGVINCTQGRWLNSGGGAIGGWFTINYANSVPGTYSNQAVPAGADRLELTTGRTSWQATSAILNYRLENPNAVTVSGGGNVCPNPGATLTASAAGAGNTNYWQNTTSGGTNTAIASSSQTVNVAGTYYYRAQNNSTGCWGTEGNAVVTLRPAPTVDAGPNTSICTGENTLLSGSAAAPTASLTLYSTDFSGTHGWSYSNVKWSTQATNVAGGTSPELRFNWNPDETGDFSATSPIINAGTYSSLTLSFRQYVDWYSNSFIVNVDTSPDGVTWTNRWNQTITADVATTPTVNLNALAGSSFYIRFRYNGRSFYVNNWYVDDVTITGTTNYVTYSWSGGPIVSGGTTLTPVVNPGTTTNYTLTATAAGCSSIDNATVTVSNPAGNPALFGPNTWYVYAYNAGVPYHGTDLTPSYVPATTGMQYLNLDNSIISYAGWYTHNTFNINTGAVWGGTASPDDAPGYAGCPVKDDNHVFVYKRRGFPCGTYHVGNFGHDDAVRIIVDGVVVYETTACCSSNPNLYLDLGGTSEVEIRLGENGGVSALTIDFVPVINSLSVNNDTKTCYVGANSGWNTFTVGNGRALVSINPGASNLGDVSVTSYVQTAPIVVSACAPLYNPAHETAVLGRRWVINPQTQPSNNVRVRLYFDQAEHTALIPAAASSSNPDDLTSVYSDLRLSKYHHPSNTAVNGVFSDNCANVPTGSMSIWAPVGADLASNLYTGFDVNGRYTEYEITPPAFSEFWLHGSQVTSPLAVVMSSFSTTCEDDKTKITWTTASEQNSDHFTLQRSRDGYNWDAIATVNGAGTTHLTNHYEVIDNASTEVYYRLIQTDFDGQSEVFAPIISNCTPSSNELKVYPNPANGLFTVALITSESIGDATIFIQDISGKVVANRTVNVLSGTTNVSFEEKQLSPGTYIVSVQAKDKKMYTPVRLVIQ